MSLKKPTDSEEQHDNLSPADQEFDHRIAEFTRRLPERLLWLLLAVGVYDTLRDLKLLNISSRVETVFRGQETHGQAFATPIPETPKPLVPATTHAVETTEAEKPMYDFQVGQTVQILGEQNHPQGKISEIAYFNSKEGSTLSFIIVDFPNGTWGGFNPDQLKVITDTNTLATPQTSP